MKPSIPKIFLKEKFKLNGDGDPSCYIGDNYHLEQKYKLAMTKDNYNKYANNTVNYKYFDMSEDEAALLFLDMYIFMRNNQVEIKQAGIIAAMRLQLIKYGALYKKEIRNVYRDEVIVVNQATQDDYDKFGAEFFNEQGVDIFEIGQGYALLASVMSAIVFKKTGHHYTTETDTMYEKMEKSTIGDQRIPGARNILYRIALHPFGILALSNLTDQYFDEIIANSDDSSPSIAPALKLRWDSLPAGMSCLGVAKSIFQNMVHHPWYDQFLDMFKETISEIENAINVIKEDWRPYHNLSNVYGVEKKPIQMIKEHVRLVAPYLIGYLQAFEEKTNIGENKSLESYARDQQFIVNKFKMLIIKDFKSQLSTADINQFFYDMLQAQQGEGESEDQMYKRLKQERSQFKQQYKVLVEEAELRKQRIQSERKSYGRSNSSKVESVVKSESSTLIQTQPTDPSQIKTGNKSTAPVRTPAQQKLSETNKSNQ